ncbi:MAG: LysR substrate-binding domain-containing protein [Pseudomonadota bacterium]
MPQSPLLTPLVLHAMTYFDAAACHRSFTRAAEQLGVTQGAVSQQIKALEEQVGVRLFKRLPRGLALSVEGERLHRVVARLLRELETELQAIQPSVPGTALVVRSSPSFSMMWLMPRLGGFSRRHPDIDLRLRGELFGMGTAREPAGATDVLVVYGPPPARGDRLVTPLMDEYLLPVASQAYLAGQAAITGPADFAAHRLLHDDSPWEGAAPFTEWGDWLRAAGGRDDPDIGRVVCHGDQYQLSQFAINAALLGRGVAMARVSLVLEELARGQLSPALPGASRASAGYWLVMHAAAAQHSSARVFRDWIVDACRAFQAERDAVLRSLSSLD